MTFKLIHPTPISWFLLFDSGKSIPRVLSYKDTGVGTDEGCHGNISAGPSSSPCIFSGHLISWVHTVCSAHLNKSLPLRAAYSTRRDHSSSVQMDNVNSPAKAERRTCQSQLGRNHLVQRKRGQRIITVCHEGAGNRGWEGVSIVRYAWNDPDTQGWNGF